MSDLFEICLQNITIDPDEGKQVRNTLFCIGMMQGEVSSKYAQKCLTKPYTG